MSKKILSIGLMVVGIVLAIPSVGASLGLSTLAVAAIEVGIALTQTLLLAPKPKKMATNATDRLHASLDPGTPRKFWFGRTAAPTDVRYQGYSGSSQEYLEEIICVASHKVNAIEEIWFDNEKAWSSSGGVLGRYVGYLTAVDVRLEGTSSNGIAIDGVWTSSATLTGCAYIHLKVKLTGNSSKATSPFSGGLTSRITIRGKGALVYDPRKDSTVAGGSGSHRANDQTTWQWDDNGSRNPALQELFYELGWKIGGKLAIGKGVPPSRIDLASYAVAANVCDETVTLVGGVTTEPRYRSDGVVSEADDTQSVRDNFCATMNAILKDSGGKLSVYCLHNDLSTPVVPSGKSAFDANDILGEMTWEQTPDLSSTFNIVRGKRIDPTDNALYQPVDFAEVSITSTDGIDRIDTVDYPFVESNSQAQRLAKQRLQRGQYQGRLNFTGGPNFWGLSIGDVFPLTLPTFGWSAKLFRCASQRISKTGETEIIGVEENAAIYAWDKEEAPAVVAGTPTIYDPLNNPFIGGIGDASNSAAPGDSNRVRYSLFERDTYGWGTAGNSSGLSNSISKIVSNGINYLQSSTNFTANGQSIENLGTTSTSLADPMIIPVTAGERLFVSAIIAVSGITSAGSWGVNIGWVDSTGAETGTRFTLATGFGQLLSATRQTGFVTVPAGAVGAFFRTAVLNGTGGALTAFMILGQPMVAGAGTAQTVIPPFSPGPDNEPAANVGAIGDSNRVTFSLFEQDVLGYYIYDNPTSAALYSVGTGSGKKYVHLQANFTANGQVFSHGTAGYATPAYRIKVTPGERLAISCQYGVTMPDSRCTSTLRIGYYDDSLTFIGSTDIFNSRPGSDTFPTYFSTFSTVPAGATFAIIIHYVFNNSFGITGTVHSYLSEIMVCGAASNQLVIPPFSPGPSNEPAANVGATGDSNRVTFSLVEQDLLGYSNYNNISGATAFDTSTSSGKKRVHLQDDFTASSQVITLGTTGAGDPTSPYRILVAPGERIFVSASIGSVAPAGGCSTVLTIFFYDSTGTNLSNPDIYGALGSVSFPTRVGGFVTVPPNAAFAILRLAMFNNATGAGANAHLYMAEPMLCGAQIGQTVWPPFSPGPSNEAGAQINRWIDGPAQNTTFEYDYTGTVISGEFNRDFTFKLNSSFGTQSSGVTWSYKVLTGTLNGFNNSSGSQSMGVSSGVGTLTATSLGSSQATVEIKANYQGKDYTISPITFKQHVADPPVAGGSGTTTLGSKTSGWANTANTTFNDLISGGITLAALPSGKTAIDINVALNAMPASGSTGAWTVECKVLRDISGTPTQVGSTQSASSDWNATDVSGDAAPFNFTIHDTGLTAGVAYKYYIQMRVSTGGTRTHTVTGTASWTA